MGLALGPLSPPWVEAVPPWNAATPDGLPLSPMPPLTGIVPPVDIAVPAVTGSHRPARSPHAPGRAKNPGRPLIPPRDRADRAQGPPTPRSSPQASPQASPLASPQAPAPSRPIGSSATRRADPPPARGLPNPCATMNDFRRQPCDQLRDQLLR
ncbi:hypothetical protein FXF51_36700 [Nonomuraea sp. PA05]|uniref:hypothetical protein n=1 Tax=Nonomuraea sp. PA05 TaxID=2604466 RepID=UPI0011DABC7C|nr:hypothetical protein [Nonomuraea sp. PA05]TYB58621.1 hypothetical protein FXF51_36700 [Nonomuraea sp. PA05]